MDAISKEIAAIAAERRRALGLRQEELADLAGVSTRFIHSLEHAKPTIRLDKLLAVFDVLGVTLSLTVPGAAQDQLPGPSSS